MIVHVWNAKLTKMSSCIVISNLKFFVKEKLKFQIKKCNPNNLKFKT